MDQNLNQSPAQKSSKFFYGWVVVVGIMLIQGAAIGILSNTLSTFYKPVSDALGVSRSTFTLYNTFGMVSGMVMAPLWGEFFRNRRFKPYMLIGSVIVAICMFGYSRATHVYHFYLIASVKGVFQGMLTGVPVAKILSNWFIEKRGTATGLALAGSGLAGMIMTPVISRTIQNSGWRTGYMQLGIVFFVITVPVLLLLVKETPEEMGLKPYGYDPNVVPVTSATGLQSGMTRSQAFRSKTYWFYMAGLFLTQFTCMSISNNIISHLTDIGYEASFAATIFSMMMGVLVIGKIVLGRIYDVAGVRNGTIIITLLLAAAPSVLAFTHIPGVPYAFVVVFGLAYASATMQLPYMTPRLFGNKDYTRVYGVCQPFMSLGSAFSAPISNALQAQFGSYVPVFFMLSGLALLSLLCMLLAISASPKEVEKFDRADGLLPAASAE